MGVPYDDGGSGKAKSVADLRQRRQQLASVFALGALLGLMLAERLYLAANRDDILAGVSTMTRVDGAGGTAGGPAGGGGGGSGAGSAGCRLDHVSPDDVAAAIGSDPELRDLHEFLLRVAPEGEVLIGVSNQRPLQEGMLDTWLEGVKQAGVSCERVRMRVRGQRAWRTHAHGA